MAIAAVIPTVIHRWWTGPPSPLEPWLGLTLRSLHPRWTVHDWTDDTLPFTVDDHPELVLPAEQVRHRSNVVRYRLLAAYGGWWLDHDLVLLHPLTDLPQVPTIASLHDRPEGCLISSEAGDPVMAALAETAICPGRPPFAANVSGAALLATADGHWRHEPRVIPFGATGSTTDTTTPIGVHLWTSSANHSRSSP
jgi:hypothetical protein